MILKNVLAKIEKAKPKVIKTVTNTAQGYLFGCMLGMFITPKRPTFGDIHRSGKNIAKVCAVYSVTENILETIRGKEDIYNSMISGATAGTFCVNGKFSSMNILGGSSLGVYSGLNHYFGTQKN